ncbi:hypothetical protein KR009_003539 [Drosophila setifemur]|nr:hypothetical protein KR009_003539 [Drosophila setifemur]
MVDLVEWCLYITYISGRFTGVLNFEIDVRTGRARVTKRATICAVFAQVFILIFLLYHTISTRAMTDMMVHANGLYKSVSMVVVAFRIISTLLAVIGRWCHRGRFMQLHDSFQSLYRRNPEISQYCRMGIVCKVLCGLAVEASQLSMGLFVVQKDINYKLAIGTWSVVALSAIVNVILTQYYIAMANIRGSYILLNKELKAVLVETESLTPNRSGVFVTKCCYLADRLDEIAETQSQLQDLFDRLTKTFEFQVLCFAVTTYLNMVCGSYFMFSEQKHSSTEDWPGIVKFLGGIFFVFFYLDNTIIIYNIFHLLNLHAEMVSLLNERSILPPGLDQRLEVTVSVCIWKNYSDFLIYLYIFLFQFENFQLNLIRNPFRLRFFYAIDVDRFTFFIVGNSMISNSILLIQYDIENY